MAAERDDPVFVRHILDAVSRIQRYTAASVGRMLFQGGSSAPVYCQLQEVLEQLELLDELMRETA